MRIGLALVAALLFGCVPGGDGDGDGSGGGGAGDMGPGGPGDAVEAAEWQAALAGFYCDFIRTCRVTSDDLNVLRLFIEAGGDCEMWLGRQFSELSLAVATGEATIDAAAFETCSTRALALCADIDDLPECRAVISGTREAGAPCAGNDYCAPGHYCSYGAVNPDDGDECTDVCAPRLAPGEPCDYDRQCADEGDRGGYCRYLDPGAAEGTCVTVRFRGGASLGEQCGFIDDEGGPSFVGCGADLYCTADGGEDAGACQRVHALGEACADEETPCDGGFCIGGTCTALDIGSSPGDACGQRMLRFCNPFAGLVCIDGVCTATDGSQGAPCSDGEGGVPCNNGLYCTADDVCSPQLADGEPCDPSGAYDACASRYCASTPDGEGGTCAADPFEGQCL